jgi:hypothetical protein
MVMSRRLLEVFQVEIEQKMVLSILQNNMTKFKPWILNKYITAILPVKFNPGLYYLYGMFGKLNLSPLSSLDFALQ